jgi:molybdenum cofactor synthesis domain-containing protein
MAPTSARARLPAAIPVAEARLHILSRIVPLPPRRLPLNMVSGHVLAETVCAAENVPPFANSAMDGYAVRAADTTHAPVCLRVTGTVAAGEEPQAAVSRGAAMRIMTGAPLPGGADAVCMVERTRAEDGGSAVIIEETVSRGTNVRWPGEDIAAGTEVFAAGTQLGPAHVGVLASLGIEMLLAYPRPTVGVLSTGDELARPGAVLAGGKIRDANRPALLAQLGSDGFRTVDLGMAGDDEPALANLLEASASRCDAIIASGGVSVGDHDVLKVALRKLGGATMSSLRVAVKPGQHIAVALLGDRRVPAFGLPGNPVATLVSYELFVRPALRAMAGSRVLDRLRISAIAETDLPRRPGPKLHLLRVTARTGSGGALLVRPSGGQDSHMLRAMAQANALALLPDGDGVRAGGRVEVMLLDAELV